MHWKRFFTVISSGKKDILYFLVRYTSFPICTYYQNIYNIHAVYIKMMNFVKSDIPHNTYKSFSSFLDNLNTVIALASF